MTAKKTWTAPSLEDERRNWGLARRTQPLPLGDFECAYSIMQWLLSCGLCPGADGIEAHLPARGVGARLPAPRAMLLYRGDALRQRHLGHHPLSLVSCNRRRTVRTTGRYSFGSNRNSRGVWSGMTSVLRDRVSAQQLDTGNQTTPAETAAGAADNRLRDDLVAQDEAWSGRVLFTYAQHSIHMVRYEAKKAGTDGT